MAAANPATSKEQVEEEEEVDQGLWDNVST